MNQRIKNLSDEIRKLTPAEQAELMEEIADLVDMPPDPAIEQAWIEEAERRLAAIERGEVQTIPVEKVIADLHARFKRRP